MSFKKYLTCFILAFSFLLAGCYDEDSIGSEFIEVQNRTVLIYMAADNSLGSNQDDAKNLKLMMQAVTEREGSIGNLIVYWDPVKDVPKLLKIEWKNGEAVQTVIETYEEENSASPEVLSRVIEDTKRLFPADSYGLVLWSHGLGWIPANHSFSGGYKRTLITNENLPRTKFLGQDYHSGNGTSSMYMDIPELVEALPDGLAFIMFDACLMSSIEVLYELRNKAEYLIASPAEVIADGFPYHKITPYFWGGENEMKDICEEFYNYYNTHPNGGKWNSATIALIKTSELDELHRVSQEILQGRKDEAASMATGDVWRYNVSSSSVPNVFYDLGEYMKYMATPNQYSQFSKQMEKTVIYKKATPKWFEVEIPEDKFSGVTTYIPIRKWTTMNDYYFTNSIWAQTVY